MREVRLTQGMIAMVSDSDYQLVKQFKWQACKSRKTWYTSTTVPNGRHKPISFSIHRLICGFPSFDLDHKNRNGLDNRRSNLRLSTESENLANAGKNIRNTSGFKGVTLSGRKKLPWQAGIQVNKRYMFLGRYLEREEAAIAYMFGAILFFGEFARA